MRSKKGQASGQKMVSYIVLAILLAILFLLFAVLILPEEFLGSDVPEGLEEFIFTHRFLTSSDCFVPQSSEFLQFSGETISWDKFNQNNLDTCYRSDTSKKFRLTLVDFDAKDRGLEEDDYKKTISTQSWAGSARKRESIDINILRDNKIVSGQFLVESK